MILFFDTETCGVPANYRAPLSDSSNWPRLVQIAWLAEESESEDPVVHCHLIRPDGWTIPEAAAAVHGISQKDVERDGRPLAEVLGEFLGVASKAELLVGHNLGFDLAIVGAELCRLGFGGAADLMVEQPSRCTMRAGADLCRLSGRYGYKWPRLEELHRELFGTVPDLQHRADADVLATARCYYEMVKRGVFEC